MSIIYPKKDLVFILLLIVSVSIPTASFSHSMGIINLTSCSRRGGPANQYKIHFDAYQAGDGPFCYQLPKTTPVRLVLDFQNELKRVPVSLTIRKGVITEQNSGADILESPRNIYTVKPDTYQTGVLSRKVTFPESGSYTIIINVPSNDVILTFPLYVGVKAPFSMRVKTTLLSALERPYFIIFGLLIFFGFGLYFLRSPQPAE